MKQLKNLLLAFLFAACGDRVSNDIHPKGGYNFLSPAEVNDSDFFALPLKDKISRNDSFSIYYFLPITYRKFDEENLSVRPMGKPIFRMLYFDGPLSAIKPVVIKLSESEIEVKEGYHGTLHGYFDSTKLTKEEHFHYRILSYNSPLSNPKMSARSQNYYDSLLKIYPELDDPTYFKSLLDKSTVYDDTFRYKVTKRRVSKKSFNHFLGLVNESEFWNCQFDCDCRNTPFDAASYYLEANASPKYQLISSVVCPNDNRKIVAVCDELFRLAGLDSKIKIEWNEPPRSERNIVKPSPVQLQGTHTAK